MGSKYVFKQTNKMKADGAGMKSAFNSRNPVFDTGRASGCLSSFNPHITFYWVVYFRFLLCVLVMHVYECGKIA
jgi:hypothetical protein